MLSKDLYRVTTTSLFALATMALAFAVQAQYPRPMPMPMMPGMPTSPVPMGVPGGYMHNPAAMNPLAALGLSEEQLSKLAEIDKEKRKTTLALMADIGKEAAKLRELYTADELDAKAIGAVYGKIFDLQQQAIEMDVASYSDQLAVFTPEQREKWQTMRKGMMAHFGQGGATPQQ